MRLARLVVIPLTALALVACDEESPGNVGGTGGGDDHPAPIDCGGVRVVEMESSTSVVLVDHTDTVGNWFGSCTPLVDPELTGGPRVPGNDVIVRFVVPEDGIYRFSTAGSDFDTLLYVLEDCKDGFTELSCNDDFEGKQSAVTVLDRKVGEDIFVVVDSVDIRQSREFKLAAERLDPASVPVIANMDAFFNEDELVAGLRIVGTNPVHPLIGVSLQVYDPEGTALAPEAFVFTFDELDLFDVTQGDGSFVLEGSFSFGNPRERIGAIEVNLFDDYGLPTETVKKAVTAPPTVGRGEPCDPSHGLNVCEGTDVCRADVPVCTAA